MAGSSFLASCLVWACAALAFTDIPASLAAASPPAVPVEAKSAAQGQTPGSGTVRRPNIVILLADDWGFSDVGAFGGEMATPHLDALASRGVRFSNFHASASCSPSRAMLLTGVDSHLNGVGNMRETIPLEHAGKPGYLSVLNDRVVTISTLLRDGGYRTYASGKWHVGKAEHNLPPARGFDRSIIQGDSGSDNWDTAQRYLDLGDKVDWYEDGKPAVMARDYYSSAYFVDRMMEFIGSGAGSGKPFFAYLAFQANHIPVQAPRSFIDKYKGRYDGGWDVLRQARRDKAAALGLIPANVPMVRMNTTAQWDALSPQQRAYEARRMEVYAGMAEAMDFHVGRLVDDLKRRGEYDNTVFVFLSDNGAEASDPYETLAGRAWLFFQYTNNIEKLGDKGAYAVIGPSWASAAVSPLATYKFYSGEGGVRVPLIISGAPGVSGNQIHRSFVDIKDIAPTLLDLAGLPMPGKVYGGKEVEPMSGKSLLSVMRGESASAHAPDESMGYELSGNQALFRGDLKLIRNIAPVGDGQWHLYDIVRDPGETRDLKDEQPEMFRRMQDDYDAYARRHGVLPMPPGYEPRHQVLVNALVNVYVPRYRPYALPALALVMALVAFMLMRRRRKV